MGDKLLSKRTLRMKLITIFIPLLLLPLIIVSVLIYEKSKNIIQNNASMYTQEYLNQLSNNIDYKMSEVIKISAQMAVNTQLSEGLMEYHNSSVDKKTRISDNINDVFSNTLSVYGDVNGIYVFDNYDNEFYAKKRYIGSGRVSEEEWYQEAISSNGKYTIFIREGAKKTIGVARSVIDIYSKKSIGVILVELPYTMLEKSIKGNSNLSEKSGVIYVLDNDNNIIYNSGEEQTLPISIDNEIISRKKDGYLTINIEDGSKFVVYHSSPALNWKFIYICSLKELMKDMSIIRTTLYSISGILIVISCALAITLSTYLLKPLKELIQAMKKVERGDYSVRIEPKTEDEMKYLMISFNHMTDHIEKLIQSEYSAKLSQKEAHLDMLQQQINPHFLYNTFEVLRGIAITEGNKEIANMVKALSNFMRYNLYRGKSITTVEEEIKHITNYLIIQNYRFDDKIQLELEVPDEIRILEIPKFTLQPLIENAVLHGIIAKKDKGLIKIIGTYEGTYASIVVWDNGMGMPFSTVEKLNLRLHHSTDLKKTEQSSIGTLNVNERLKLNFGKEYGLYYASVEGVETTVEVRIPLHNKGER